MEYTNSWKAIVNDREISISTGNFAAQADGAVMVREGDTMLLATAVITAEPRDGIDYMPLMVDYEEKFYATGKINGSRFIKREGRPSENAVLTSRLIDRAIRPLFPKSFRRDVQVIVTVLSVDEDNDTDTLAIIAASAALTLAPNAPFNGPVGAIRVGRVDNELIMNPTKGQMETSDLDLVIAGTSERVMMLEAGANEVPDSVVHEAIVKGLAALQPTVAMQNEAKSGKDVMITVEEEAADAAYDLVKNHIGHTIEDVTTKTERSERHAAYENLKARVVTELEGQFKQSEILAAVEKVYFKNLRALILERELRPDGRGITEVRQIGVEAGLLPRTHGSALFSRGESQALSIVTLGGPGDAQMVDTMDEDTTKRYMHHYNFPPFSTGETSPLRGAGRREIGHGALAERALEPMIPPATEFPYTIRVVSEILSSNGSTSMASVCGSTLSLMDAGVPLKKPVSGIAMGLVTNDDASQFKVLTDLQGLEDFAGDMDFKIAGTADGITAIQMDTKIAGLTMEIVEQTMKQAKTDRLHILGKMLESLPAPRADLSAYAPRIVTVPIDPAKIGELIGPGGKVINKIVEMCGGKEVTSIDIDDVGLVMITSTNAEMGQKAIAMVEGIAKEIEVGAVYEGEVTGFVTQRDTGKEIGAVVQLTPNKNGMVHISEIANERVEKLGDKLSIGQIVKVKVLDVDSARGRIALSIKALLPRQERDAHTT